MQVNLARWPTLAAFERGDELALWILTYRVWNGYTSRPARVWNPYAKKELEELCRTSR